MNVLYLSLSPVPSQAANSVQVIKTCAAMVRVGHSVRLFCAEGKGNRDPAELGTLVRQQYGISEEFAIHTFPLGTVRLLSRALYGLRLSRAIRPYLGETDLIYGREIYALASVRKHTLPIIYESHMPPANFFKVVLHRMLFRSPSFKRLVTVSRRLGEYFLAHFPELTDRELVIAPNGADAPYPPEESPSSHPRRSVGYVGQLYRHKGPELVVDLARVLRKVDFHIVGGTEEDIAYWRGHATENVTFHGHVSQRELASYYRSFLVVLAPYRRDASVSKLKDDTEWGSPLKIFEYMSYGCCMVASDLPVIRELVGENEAARLCDPDDTMQWTATVRRLLENPEERGELAEAAYHRYETMYTRDEKIRRVLR